MAATRFDFTGVVNYFAIMLGKQSLEGSP